jgi:hypothetical protein
MKHGMWTDRWVNIGMLGSLSLVFVLLHYFLASSIALLDYCSCSFFAPCLHPGLLDL